EVALNAIHPGGVGGYEDHLDAVFARPLPDILTFVGREVVQNDVERHPARIWLAQLLQEVQEFLSSLAQIDRPTQHIRVNVVEGQHMAYAKRPAVGRRQLLDPASLLPGSSMIGPQYQRPNSSTDDRVPDRALVIQRLHPRVLGMKLRVVRLLPHPRTLIGDVATVQRRPHGLSTYRRNDPAGDGDLAQF